MSEKDYLVVIIMLERIFENNYHLHKDKLLGRSGKRGASKDVLYKSLLEHPVDDCQVFGLFALYMFVCVCVCVCTCIILYIYRHRYNKSHQFYQWPLLAFAVLTTGKDEKDEVFMTAITTSFQRHQEKIYRTPNL